MGPPRPPRGLEEAGTALPPGTCTHGAPAGSSAWGSGEDPCGNSRQPGVFGKIWNLSWLPPRAGRVASEEPGQRSGSDAEQGWGHSPPPPPCDPGHGLSKPGAPAVNWVGAPTSTRTVRD